MVCYPITFQEPCPQRGRREEGGGEEGSEEERREAE